MYHTLEEVETSLVLHTSNTSNPKEAPPLKNIHTSTDTHAPTPTPTPTDKVKKTVKSILKTMPKLIED